MLTVPKIVFARRHSDISHAAGQKGFVLQQLFQSLFVLIHTLPKGMRNNALLSLHSIMS